MWVKLNQIEAGKVSAKDSSSPDVVGSEVWGVSASLDFKRGLWSSMAINFSASAALLKRCSEPLWLTFRVTGYIRNGRTPLLASSSLTASKAFLLCVVFLLLSGKNSSLDFDVCPSLNIQCVGADERALAPLRIFSLSWYRSSRKMSVRGRLDLSWVENIRPTSRRLDIHDLSSISANFWRRFSSSFWRSPTSCFTALMLADVASSLPCSFLLTSTCCAISPLSSFTAELEASTIAFRACISPASISSTASLTANLTFPASHSSCSHSASKMAALVMSSSSWADAFFLFAVSSADDLLLAPLPLDIL
ncbi:hypothetical protein GOODEAATRI_011561 [Goodea atripinnis]|uniref:Uncharacterized protein n=1 Tax=Goodea atripinnis TaxID=208336 RepID=A0ABV0N0M1_9TELE